MAARYVVGTLAIACLFILHVEGLPRVGRDDVSDMENGSGFDSAFYSDEYKDDLGAADADDGSAEDDTDSATGRPEIPGNSGNSIDFGNGVTTKKPTSFTVIESNEIDNSIDVSNEDIGGAGSGYVSKSNEDVGTDSQDKPVFPVEDHTPDNKDVVLDLEEEEGPKESNERDKFFGKPEAVKPPIATNPVGLVGIGAKRTDVMLVFDDVGDSSVYDDDQITADPEIVSLERGDYKRDDFFDTIGMEKLDDFIPKATETKQAQDFIEGQTDGSKVMKEIFGEKSGCGGKTMKDDFFDSIAVKNIVTDKNDLNVKSGEKINQVGGSVSQIGMHGVGNGMTIEEEQKMQQLILRALRLFIGAPCYKNGKLKMTKKCAVFEDVLNALALSGLTFNSGDRIHKPIATKPGRKWQW